MIAIDRARLEAIYKSADVELRNSYIQHADTEEYGWRNGLKKEPGVSPGATATALILNYFVSCNDLWIEKEVPRILEYLLKIQLEDNGKKTGWEVMSLKPASGTRIPSVDVTAIVISTLCKHIRWMEKTPFQNNMERAIREGSQWLLDQRSGSGAWGIHKNDMNRIFVTCNVLNALIPLMGQEQFMNNSLTFLKRAQYVDGSWGDTQGNNATGDIYHTAKVLNVLVAYFSNDVQDNIQKGIKYLKDMIDSGLPDDSNIQEKIPDCNGNSKSYYHDAYSELLSLMQNTPDQWSKEQHFKVLDKFITSKSVNGDLKFYETITDQSKKKQIWLLIPAATQSYGVIKKLFTDSDESVCISDDEKMLGFDLEEADKKRLQRNGKKHWIVYLVWALGILGFVALLIFQIFIVGTKETTNNIVSNIIWVMLTAFGSTFLLPKIKKKLGEKK